MAKSILQNKHVATYLLESDFNELYILAGEKNMSLSGLVREVIKNYLQRNAKK
jgi:hypothetical protein